ncbi:hypothetical protein JavanS54_0006 [Streptococcus satellite phage Javan54]|uniref:DUF7720 family protein n=1 Tax=Streptococcus agalactiae TaxID=1311 RepID=UPI000332DD45|nr:hypothetical protein [Streptococcus agalactiae]QBX11063.1 hypothetical protein JavanS54_0006 [Streptococcus satellite phage Javan54]CCW41046.1 hypothetical protein MSA_21920 [Streptococcus agalactiae ILRI005]
MKIIELKMNTPEQTGLGYEHWVDITYQIDRKTYHLTKLILNDNMILDMAIIEKMVLSDVKELLSHAYEVLKLNRQLMKESWWLF